MRVSIKVFQPFVMNKFDSARFTVDSSLNLMKTSVSTFILGEGFDSSEILIICTHHKMLKLDKQKEMVARTVLFNTNILEYSKLSFLSNHRLFL